MVDDSLGRVEVSFCFGFLKNPSREQVQDRISVMQKGLALTIQKRARFEHYSFAISREIVHARTSVARTSAVKVGVKAAAERFLDRTNTKGFRCES